MTYSLGSSPAGVAVIVASPSAEVLQRGRIVAARNVRLVVWLVEPDPVKRDEQCRVPGLGQEESRRGCPEGKVGAARQLPEAVRKP